MTCHYQPDPSLADDPLSPPLLGERIIGFDEIVQHVAPIYNAANLSPASTQQERHKVFTAALKKLIDGGTIAPRAQPEDGRLCLVTLYDRPVSCRPVLAGSAEDLSQSAPMRNRSPMRKRLLRHAHTAAAVNSSTGTQ
jgi:hypothetical protein